MVSRNLAVPEDAVAAFCGRWKITELAVFGSALREDFRPDSDVDVLVTFSADARWGLFDMVRMKDDLAGILGREVDLVTRRGVEQGRNPLRRQAILSSAEPIYVQR
jgi:predicted nucleotidyltransferase